MKMTIQRINRIRNKIQKSRTRLMIEKPFFALLLMYISFFATNDIKTISTNGRCIYFSPDYIDRIYNQELDFLLCHLIMHIVFDDLSRPSDLQGDGYHHACDIINNKTLKEYGYTKDRYPHLGEIYNKVPRWIDETELTPMKLYCSLPYDLSHFDEKTRRRYLIDTDEMWNRHTGAHDNYVYILGPDEYNKPPKVKNVIAQDYDMSDDGTQDNGDKMNDEDTKDNGEGGSPQLKDIGYIINDILKTLEDNDGSDAGHESLLSRRNLLNTRKSKIDWRSILVDFVQEEIFDYSFTPPDRRFDDSPFFLPDFNVPDEKVKDILFMIDTSGSMSDEMITAAYSEIKGAIEQFDGKLVGWLGFFDTEVVDPIRFESIRELEIVKPYGGGGTSFDIIFDYVGKHMNDNLPASIIILTDGMAEFPDIESTMNIPVLWLLNNNYIVPPWGKIALMDI